MGTLRGDGGGSPPDGGGDPFDGLPDLPPEWGVVVVPNDPGELAEEAAEVRRELRREARKGTLDRLLGLTSPGTGEAGLPSVRLPILIMMIAVLAALVGMFALGWRRDVPGPGTSGAPQRTATTTTVVELKTLPALDLVDSNGGTTSLRSLAPAVILLTDGCECGELIKATAAAAPPGVNVVVVARTSTPRAADVPRGVEVRSLGDPTAGLRQALGPTGGSGSVALLVDRSGEVVRAVPGPRTIEAFRADLAELAA